MAGTRPATTLTFIELLDLGVLATIQNKKTGSNVPILSDMLPGD